jgi:hypothetical protein
MGILSTRPNDTVESEETLENYEYVSRTMPQPRVLLFQLSEIIDQIEPLRIKLGVTHDTLAGVLSICSKTYNSHKARNFSSMSIRQITLIFKYLLKKQESITPNARILNHAKNNPKVRDYFYEDLSDL